MISVKVQKKDDFYTGFEVLGHSDYAESGKDIVCSAVSILAYTLLNSINIIGEIDENNIMIEENEKDGLLTAKIEEYNIKTNLLFDNFLIGIELLKEDYSEYITLKHEEV